MLPANDAKRWIGEIRHILVQLHFEFFSNLGQQSLQCAFCVRSGAQAIERGVRTCASNPI